MKMTLKELWSVSDSPLVVMNEGKKILAMSYDPSRYPDLGDRTVVKQYACDELSTGVKGHVWAHNYIHVVVGV